VKTIGLARRIGQGVGEAVIHRGEPGGVGIAEIGDLDRREPAGEERQAVEAGVAREFEQEVGRIGAQGLGEIVVEHAGDMPPLRGVGPQAFGHGIDLDVIVVEEDLEFLPVEVGEERLEEVRHRVGPQVGRNDGDPQRRPGRSGARDERRRFRRRGDCHRGATEGDMFREELFARHFGQVVQHQEPGAGGVVLRRVFRDRPAVVLRRLMEAVATLERETATGVGVGLSGFQAQRAVKARQRVADPTEVGEADAEVAPRGGESGLQLHRPAEVRFGRGIAAVVGEQRAEAVVRLGIIRFELQRLFVGGDGVGGAPKTAQRGPQMKPRLAQGGRQRQGGAQSLFGLGKASKGIEHDPEPHQADIGPWIEFEGAREQGEGRWITPLLQRHDAGKLHRIEVHGRGLDYLGVENVRFGQTTGPVVCQGVLQEALKFGGRHGDVIGARAGHWKQKSSRSCARIGWPEFS
jgi:hypothetical protein